MLPFNHRLVKKKDHEKVQKFGQFVSANNLAIKFLENGLKETRVGIVVGVKYSKKAVERNLVKRKLREIFQKELKKMKKGLDIVVMARKREEEKTKNIDWSRNVSEVLEKARLAGEKEEKAQK